MSDTVEEHDENNQQNQTNRPDQADVTDPQDIQDPPPPPAPSHEPWYTRAQRSIQDYIRSLNIYQRVWIVLCVVGALIVVMPRVVSQPVIYRSAATVHFDVTRYHGLYLWNEEGEAEDPSQDFAIAIRDAQDALKQRALAREEVRFGNPTYRVLYHPKAAGEVRVEGIAPTAEEAHILANDGAKELVRQIRAAGGREVLRNLLGWELVASLRGEEPFSPFGEHLRTIIEHEAFPMSRQIEPVSSQMHLSDLTEEEKNDLTRALEARYELWTFAMNTRNATLDALCDTAMLNITTLREASLQRCANDSLAVRVELIERDKAIAKRKAINNALSYMLDEEGMVFSPYESESTVSAQRADLPSHPLPRWIILKLLATLVAGVSVGVAGVAVDRSADVMGKIRELWSYRELIRNLVMRDLRARYKGSMLGYIWTQLAPLLMMLVFLFVFTFLMPSGIAFFAVFLIVGLLPWNYCSETVSAGTRSILDNANLIKKVFFPREILPLVTVLSSLLNYVLSLPMMFLVMAIAQYLTIGTINFSWTFLYLPVVLLLQTLFLLGMILFLSSFAVFFRDVVHLVGIFVLFWFFLTPVFYSLDTLATPLVARVLRWVNPMASIVDFYREILYGSAVPVGMIPTPGLPALDSVLRVSVTVAIVLVFGYWFFQRHSGLFGEEL